MLRVAFDIHAIGQSATGNETYAEGLLQAFEAAPPGDVELHFYHFHALKHPPSRAHFRRLMPRWPYLRIPFVTPGFLALDRIDVAHFQYIAPPICPCAIVLTVHDLSYERHPEFFSPRMAAGMRFLMPWMARRARHIIAVSQATRDDIVAFYGIAAERISVIHNGAPQGFGPIEDPERLQRATARFGLDRPFIICVGNLGARKNQRLLVRAFALLQQRKSFDHDLLLVGKQTYAAEEIIAEIRRLGLESRVRVTGFVSQQELVALYNRATFSIYPSRYEGFGLPILESMACGTPVITSSVSCMPEIAGDAALLVDPSDLDALVAAMAKLLDDHELLNRLRQAGLARCRRFSWADAATRTLDVYRKAAGK